MHSIYIHIPFCKSRCKYCDFFSTTLLEQRKEYVDAVIKEWKQRRVEDITTIYLGGGTPSLLDLADLERLLKEFRRQNAQCTMHNAQCREITMEANPGDLSLEKLKQLRAMGINRLSIGVQSFRNPLLRLIGRRHNARQARQAIRWAKQAGFDNISIDLMYGLPTQTMMQWSMDVRCAIRLGVQHISCYCLSYEEGTPLSQMLEQGEIRPASERLQNRMYRFLCRVLERNGYEHYEVSNFALPGFRSRHNSNYWNNTPYIGLGAGAHSYDGIIRSWNPNDMKAYITGINNDTLVREEELLTPEQQHIEAVMLALRTKEGVEATLVKDKTDKVAQYIQQGMLCEENGRLIATKKGLNILNRIIEDLI